MECCLTDLCLSKLDDMVDRVRGWIDDVEYKIKDAFKKRKDSPDSSPRVSTASAGSNTFIEHFYRNSTPTSTAESDPLLVVDSTSGILCSRKTENSTFSSECEPLLVVDSADTSSVAAQPRSTEPVSSGLSTLLYSQTDTTAPNTDSLRAFQTAPNTDSLRESQTDTTAPNFLRVDSPHFRHRANSNPSDSPLSSSQITVKASHIDKLISAESEQQQQQNDLSRDFNINSEHSKRQVDQDSDKSEEIRILSRSTVEYSNSSELVDSHTRNISEVKLVDAGVQVNDLSGSEAITVKQTKVLNKTLISPCPRSPEIYRRSPSSPCITLLKNIGTRQQQLISSISPQQSTKDILNSLSYKGDNTGPGPRIPRSPLLKEPSTDSDEELIRKMRKNINITRGGRISFDERGGSLLSDSSSLSTPMTTDHRLLDHSFVEDTPSPAKANFAAKAIRTFRRSTSNALENHDEENDPSLSVDILNDRAKNGEYVLPEIKCDVAIRISSKSKQEVRDWFQAELRSVGLIVTSQIGYSGDYFLKVTADRDLFLKGAEKMELLKRVHPDKGDGMKPFNRNEKMIFCPRQSTDGFLTASERQLIIYDCVNTLRTESAVEVGGIKYYQHESVVSGLITNNVIKQIYPLHQKSKQNVLNRLWVWNITGQQPLNLIRHYFGDEIALYFAWLGTYTTILVVPLIVGLSIGMFYNDDDVESADWCFTFYAFFNVVWPSIFLEFWKRRSAALAWEWGTLGQDIEFRDNQRPQFTGALGENPITQEKELQYPSYKRQIKQTVSMIVSGICLFIVLISMLAVFRFDDYVQYITNSGKFPDFIPSFATRFIKYTPKILLPITVGILDVLYSNIAVSLNDWENYKHQRTYENWLVLKLILFKFVNSFLALFYIAFYLQDFDKLQETLAALLITKQIVGNCGEILGPTVTSWIKVYLLQRGHTATETTQTSEAVEKPSQVETESEKPAYESSFDDYLEMFIQMGYVILFSAAYPLAAVWAFLNNVVEIRGDAFKLVNGVQRPFIKRVEDIGFWQDAFEVLSVISIVVNCSLIGIRGQVGRWFPDFSIGQQILFVILMEHLFLTIKYIITRAIPNVPSWVSLAHAKERYKRDQALKGLEKFMRTSKLKGQIKKKVDAVRCKLEDMNSTAASAGKADKRQTGDRQETDKRQTGDRQEVRAPESGRYKIE